MPDRLHALVNLQDRDASVSAFSRLIKRSITSACPDRTWAWQQGCFDHLLRPTESASDKLAYMLVNPVIAGLVRSWRDWPYTYLSKHWTYRIFQHETLVRWVSAAGSSFAKATARQALPPYSAIRLASRVRGAIRSQARMCGCGRPPGTACDSRKPASFLVQPG
jgi:hypothetical protein